MARAKAPPKPKPEPKPPGDYELLADHYHQSFIRVIGMKPVWTTRTGKALKDMLAAMSLDEAKACIDEAWCDDFFRDKQRELYFIAANMNRYRRILPPERKAAKPVEPPQGVISGVIADDELRKKLGL